MLLHRAIFTLFFFSLKLVFAGTQDASKKSHFRCVVVSPFRPSIPIIPPPRPRAPPPDELQRRVWGWLCHTVPGVALLFYFCSVGQIKNHHDASHFPLPRPSILIIPPLCPRTLSPNNHMSRDVVVAKTDEDAAGASDDDDDNSDDEHDDDDDDDEDDDAAVAADVEDGNRHHHQPI